MSRKVISIISLFVVILFVYLISNQIIRGYTIYKEIISLNKTLISELNKESYYKKVLSLVEEYQKYEMELKKYYFTDTILSSFYFNIKDEAKKLFNVDVLSLIINDKIDIGREGDKRFNITMVIESKASPINIIKFLNFLTNESDKQSYPLFFLSSLNLVNNRATVGLFGYIYTNSDKIALSKEVLTERYTVCEIYAEILDMKKYGKPINPDFVIAEYNNKKYLCKVIERGVDLGRAELLKNQSSLKGKIYLIVKEE